MGLCECGCGEDAGTYSLRCKDGRAGKPRRFLPYHHTIRNPGPRFVETEEGCWLWRGALTERGYGLLRDGRRRVRAHRAFYQELVGPVPDGLVLDHLCRNPSCVNPGHVEPVTQAENIRRGARWGPPEAPSDRLDTTRGATSSGLSGSLGEREGNRAGGSYARSSTRARRR